MISIKKTFFTTIVIFILTFCPSFSQKFYVEKIEGNFEQSIINKLLSDDYKVTSIKDSAEYLIQCLISKAGMQRAKGSIIIINKKGDMIAKSEEITGISSIYNNWDNPKRVAIKKIAEKHLIPLIKEKLK